MFLIHRPTVEEVQAFIAASRQLPLSYEPVGLANTDGSGFQVDTSETVVGHGEAAFERAIVALTAWKHFELGWVQAFPAQAGVAPGTVVAVVIRHMGFWSMNGCRVVYPVASDNPRAFGFAYGTLIDHAERGEEIFRVALDPDSGDVSYAIRAVSRPRALLAWLGYPVTRTLQARFRRDSTAAVARAIAR